MGVTFGGILDVSISLIFIYLLLSLICTTINELIATALKLRSRSLSAAIEKNPRGQEPPRTLLQAWLDQRFDIRLPARTNAGKRDTNGCRAFLVY